MIRFKELRAVIADLHGEGGTRGALLARFKYLQRMSWPGGSNVGKGAAAIYSLEDVLALALAFELLETQMSPARVVGLLRPDWAKLKRATVSSWASLEKLGGEGFLLANVPGALGGSVEAEAEEEARGSDPLVVVVRSDLVGWLDHRRGGAAPSLYLIDLSRLVRDVALALVAVGGQDGDELYQRFRELARETFDSDRPADWKIASDGLDTPGRFHRDD